MKKNVNKDEDVKREYLSCFWINRRKYDVIEETYAYKRRKTHKIFFHSSCFSRLFRPSSLDQASSSSSWFSFGYPCRRQCRHCRVFHSFLFPLGCYTPPTQPLAYRPSPATTPRSAPLCRRRLLTRVKDDARSLIVHANLFHYIQEVSEVNELEWTL